MRSIVVVVLGLLGCAVPVQRAADVVVELSLPMPELCTESLRALRASFDGRRIVYGCQGPGPGTSLRLAELEQQLFVVDTLAGTTETLELPGLWVSFDLSFDGERLAILERELECAREPCVYTLRVLEGPSWAPVLDLTVPELSSVTMTGDGRHVLFESGGLTSVDVDDGTFERFAASGLGGVSEDGRSVVLVTERTTDSALSFVDLEAGEEARFEVVLAYGAPPPVVSRDARSAYVGLVVYSPREEPGRWEAVTDWWLLGADGSAVDVPEPFLIAPDGGVVLLAESTPESWLLWTPERTELLDVSWWPTAISRDGSVMMGFDGALLRAVVMRR